MAKLGLSAPWEIYYKEINELFRRDREISVIFDDDEFKILLYVDNQRKAEIIEKVLPAEVDFGRKLSIIVVPSNSNVPYDEDYCDWDILFDGNDACSYVYKVGNIAGFNAIYVVFENRVVQYYTDNLGDINGFESTLYQNIARKILKADPGVFFCTDVKVGEDATVGAPLVQWP